MAGCAALGGKHLRSSRENGKLSEYGEIELQLFDKLGLTKLGLTKKRRSKAGGHKAASVWTVVIGVVTL